MSYHRLTIRLLLSLSCSVSLWLESAQRSLKRDDDDYVDDDDDDDDDYNVDDDADDNVDDDADDVDDINGVGEKKINSILFAER